MSVDDCLERLREQKRRRLGSRYPKCELCDEGDPLALTGLHPHILCGSCRAASQPALEAHHVAGRHNDPLTVNLPRNPHRVITEQQTLWPRDTLTNPHGSPLLEAAAWLRGFLLLVRTLMERGLDWIPPLLEWIDQKLTTQLGQKWWEELGWTGRDGS